MGFAIKSAYYKSGDVLNRWFMPAATQCILPPTGPTVFLLGMQYVLSNEDSEFFQLRVMRINFPQKSVPWLRRLFADVSSLEVIVGRSKRDTRMWWTRWHYDTDFAPSTSVSPVSITPPMSVLSSPWYYSLSGEAQDLKKCIKLFSFVLFIYTCCSYIPEAQWPLNVSSRFAFKNPTFCQQNTVLRFVWLAQKSISLYTMYVQRVYCAVRTVSVHTVQIKFSLQRIQIHSDKRYLHKTLTITKCITQFVLLCQFRTRSQL
jgi:hypothetical protein